MVEVVNIKYFFEENVPLPVNKTKRIIQKCMDEELDLPQQVLMEDNANESKEIE
ncbi:MAG TPA: hypothetical protein GXX75_21955 [Clostridiales bacterium]|nr:hypothetical protein [Clostridiales bacterium]